MLFYTYFELSINPMTNIATLLKSEISRVARKEVRAELQQLKKGSTQYRSDIAAMKRRILSLEGQLRRFGKSSTPKPADAVAGESSPTRLRFSAKGFASQRKRLGLSAVQMASLLGVSDQSVRKWEEGKAHPRAGQLPAIATMRKMGKTQAVARLTELAV